MLPLFFANVTQLTNFIDITKEHKYKASVDIITQNKQYVLLKFFDLATPIPLLAVPNFTANQSTVSVPTACYSGLTHGAAIVTAAERTLK